MHQSKMKCFLASFLDIESKQILRVLLILMILALPSLEAPKTIFLVLFIIIFLATQRTILSLKQITVADYLLFSWIIVGFIVAKFAGIQNKEWGGAVNAMLIPLFLFCLKHCQFNDKEMGTLLISVIISSLLASSVSVWLLYTHQKNALELNSVGHVNHSSIYLCINYALALAFSLTQKPTDLWVKRLLFITIVLILGSLVIISDSRGSTLAMLIITITYGLIWIKKSKTPLVLFLLASVLISSELYLSKTSIVQKTLSETSSGSGGLSERIKIWNSALLIWRHNPVFGLGIKNFSQATQEKQAHWLNEENKTYTDKLYLPYPHGHSLYFNTLAEQGIIGVSVIFFNLLTICYFLYRYRPKLENEPIYWLLWLAAFGTMQVILINGLFNTTLHHEHGILSVLIIGLWWSRIKLPITTRHS